MLVGAGRGGEGSRGGRDPLLRNPCHKDPTILGVCRSGSLVFETLGFGY